MRNPTKLYVTLQCERYAFLIIDNDYIIVSGERKRVYGINHVVAKALKYINNDSPLWIYHANRKLYCPPKKLNDYRYHYINLHDKWRSKEFKLIHCLANRIKTSYFHVADNYSAESEVRLLLRRLRISPI